jgi:glycosyltransferase involved in cell wall biosynthesis
MRFFGSWSPDADQLAHCHMSDQQIRVLHLIDSLELGGAQTALLAWLGSHDRQRFEVHVAAMHGTKSSLFYERFHRLGIRLILLSPRRLVPVYLLKLPLLIIKCRYQVVHCHLFASNWLGKPLARLLGVPVVISHDQCNDAFRSNSPVVTWIDRLANRCADKIVAVSESVKDFLVSAEEVAPAKIEVIPNGVPDVEVGVGWQASTSGMQRISGPGKRIGGAGRLVPQKNFGRFIRIAKLLSEIDSSYRFTVAGAGPLETELKREGALIEWRGVEPSLDKFFSEIDFFLMTSDFEGMPMALLEAMQKGVPAGAVAVDGIREQFSSSELLLLDPSADDREVARQIHARMQDQRAIAEQARAARELIGRRFSARQQIRTIEQIYIELLRKTGR